MAELAAIRTIGKRHGGYAPISVRLLFLCPVGQIGYGKIAYPVRAYYDFRLMPVREIRKDIAFENPAGSDERRSPMRETSSKKFGLGLIHRP
jgi:hypothetical protein